MCGSYRRYRYAHLEAGDYVRCRRCATVFADPRPSDAVLVSRLDEFAPDTSGDTPGALEAMVDGERWKLDLVVPASPPAQRPRLLDVGCGSGAFVAAAARAGYDAEGHDLAPKVAAAAGARWSRPVHTGELRTLATERPAAFDVVTMWDALEHAVSPRDLLADVARLLAPGGRVFVLSPNSHGVSARTLRGRWWAFGPNDHLVLFSGDALAEALRDAGLTVDVVTTRSLSPPYPPEDADPRRPLMRVYDVVARRDRLQTWLAGRGLGDWILAIAYSEPARVSS
jgi:SAM-dependent methyltransferase